MLDDVKFEKGPAKRRLTRQEAEELGAGVFTLRLHLFNEKKDSSRVFLSLIPGTVDDLPPGIQHFNDRESFPTLLYPMYDSDGDSKHARLSPPADPGRKFGTYVLGVINTIALPLATDGLVLTVDPRQYINSIRYLHDSSPAT